MKEKWTPHIIAAGAFVVFIVLGLACASGPTKQMFPVPEYSTYSETIDIPKQDAKAIYKKTEIWLQEQLLNASYFLTSSQTLLKAESEIKVDNLSFNIKDEHCQLTIQHDNQYYAISQEEANAGAAGRMNQEKNLVAGYKAYITSPILSKTEIDALIAKGDAAYADGKYSEAERYYRQALKSTLPNADILVSIGLCLDELIPPSMVERFIIDRNKIMRAFNERVAHKREMGYQSRIGDYDSDRAYSGYDEERSRFYGYYNTEIKNLDRVMIMYNAALSIDRNNEAAFLNSEYIKERKAYLERRRSEIVKELDNIKELLKAEAKRFNDEKFNADVEKLAGYVENLRQIKSGNTVSQGGAYEGASSSDSGSSSSSSRKNDYDIARARSSYDKDIRICESAYKNIKDSGDYSAQQRRTFQQAQNRMRKTRQEAASNGYTISKSKWEDEALP
jgi:tetratricopeptide (TPR) repeat protein